MTPAGEAPEGAGGSRSARGRRLLRIAIGAVFTALVVWLAASRVTPETLGRTFSRLDWSPALGALAVYVAVVMVRAVRFAAAGARASTRTLFGIAAVHAALLRVMPLRSGELAYGVLLKRSGGGGLGEGLAAIALLRLLDLATILPVAAALLALGPVGVSREWAAPALLVAAVALMAVFFALGPASRALTRRLGEPGRQRGGRGLAARAAATLAQSYDLPLPRRLGLVALTALMWVLVLAWFYLNFRAVGLSPSPIEGASVGVLGVVGSILPLSLIGTFGPMEGGFALGLVAVGHEQSAAIAASIVISSLTFLANWIVALPAWLALLARRPDRR